MDIQILDSFLTPSIENIFGDDIASSLRAMRVKASSRKTYHFNEMASKKSESQLKFYCKKLKRKWSLTWLQLVKLTCQGLFKKAG